MSKLSIFKDVPARICWKYLHNGLSPEENERMWICFHNIVPHSQFIHFAYEIAYHKGYAKSFLFDEMSETTYKKKKKIIKDNILMCFGKEAS